MTVAPRRAAAAGMVACLFLVTTAACAPPRNLASGLKGYSTDIVLGSQAKPALPPSVPMAAQAPSFPSFFAPPPPVFAKDAPPPLPGPVVQAEPCPVSSPGQRPLAAAANAQFPPKRGVYPVRQHGIYTENGKVRATLPPLTERTVTNLVVRPDSTFSFDVIVEQFGSKTTTTYDIVRRAGESDVDGIYIAHVVKVPPKGDPEEFAPIPPGLRILPLPAAVGETWHSVATDPVHGTASTLDGNISEVGHADACGKLVDGWLAVVKITIKLVGTPENQRDIAIDGGYIVAPQLGGIIVADSTKLTGTVGAATITQETVSVINSLGPVRPPPP